MCTAQKQLPILIVIPQLQLELNYCSMCPCVVLIRQEMENGIAIINNEIIIE